MKTAHDYMLEAFGPEWSGKVWDMDRLKAKVERAITEAVFAERERNVQAVMDLCLTLREMGGEPRLIDLVKLAKRIRARTPEKRGGK